MVLGKSLFLTLRSRSLVRSQTHWCVSAVIDCVSRCVSAHEFECEISVQSGSQVKWDSFYILFKIPFVPSLFLRLPHFRHSLVYLQSERAHKF